MEQRDDEQPAAVEQPAPPPMPAMPPPPAQPPEPLLAAWLRAPRPSAEPGIWRHEYARREAPDPARAPTRQLVLVAAATALAGWVLWELMLKNFLGPYWVWPAVAVIPNDWRGDYRFVYAIDVYNALVITGIALACAKLGHWLELYRRMRDWYRRGGGPHGAAPKVPPQRPAPTPDVDPARWPEMRTGGAESAADRLTADLGAGLMNDVDHARIRHAWHGACSRPSGLAGFIDTVLAHGAAAFAHPSGLRDLPRRTAAHDLSLRQVRIGTATDTDRNPHSYRGAGIALEPALLGTSALVVGPPSSGKTEHLVRPVVESLCLQALAGQAAVISVGVSGGADEAAYDVVVRLGAEPSTHGLDIYGGAADPDEAAAVLAEALAGDLLSATPGGDSRRAATVLAQLLGPYRAARSRFPSVAELRDLLDGGTAVQELRDLLDGDRAYLRELAAFERQSGDTAALLADRIALLDRPVFAAAFPQAGGDGERRPFSLRALNHPVRVRVDLPERGHAEASRILARLVLAQFVECATARADRSRFACLILDDASQTITPQALRGLQHLRSANAGAVLTLRSLVDVPDHLRAPLLGAVGCRAVCAGITPWDAERFAEAWGTEWVDTRTVTNRQLVADEPWTKVMHGIRRFATGRHVTAESVTVKQERRERWSASDLANDLPSGHAVVSVTTVRGDRSSPILTKLGT